MDAADVIKDLLQRLQRHFGGAMKDLSAEDLHWQPVPDANSVGFLLWHLLRTWDGYLAMVDGLEETYEQEGWGQRFGFNVDGSETGTGFTPADVAAVRPGVEQLQGYLDALAARTVRYLSAASPAELDREVIVPWWPEPSTAGGILAHILMHSLLHIGEAEYVRGLKESRKVST